jgi:hypothetical protein
MKVRNSREFKVMHVINPFHQQAAIFTPEIKVRLLMMNHPDSELFLLLRL